MPSDAGSLFDKWSQAGQLAPLDLTPKVAPTPPAESLFDKWSQPDQPADVRGDWEKNADQRGGWEQQFDERPKPQPTGLVPWVKNTAEDVAQGIKEAFTGGEGRESVKGLDTMLTAEIKNQILGTSKPGEGMSYQDGIKSAKQLWTFIMSPGDKDKKEAIQERYPGTTVHDDKYGQTIFTLPNGKQTVLNKNGLDPQDAAEFAGEMTAFYITSKIPGFRAKAGQGFIKKMAQGAVRDATTQTAIEASTGDGKVNLLNVGSAFALGGLGEGAESGIKYVARLKKAKRLGIPESSLDAATKDADGVNKVVKQVTATKKIGESGNMKTFTRAQKTLDPYDLEKQSYVSRLPEGSPKAQETFIKQNKEASRELSEVLDMIAPHASTENAGKAIQKAAKQSIEAHKKVRRDISKPFYDQAAKDMKFHKVSETRTIIKDSLKDVQKGTDMREALDKANLLITANVNGKPVVRGLRMGQLKLAKETMDDMIKKAERKGNGSVAFKLNKVRESLVKELGEANPAYKEATRLYRLGSPAVTEAKESALGKIAKRGEGVPLEDVAAKVFKPGRDPRTLRKMRAEIRQRDPEAWNSIVREWIEGNRGKMKPSSEETAAEFLIPNEPNQMLRSIIGNKSQRDLLYASLDQETAKRFRYMENGWTRQGAGRPGGSQTAGRLQMEEEWVGGKRKVAEMVASPLKKIAEVGRELERSKNLKAEVDVMFNPKWADEWKELRKYPAKSARAQRIFKKMFHKSLGALKPGSQAAKPEMD